MNETSSMGRDAKRDCEEAVLQDYHVMTWGLWIGGLALLATACAATWFLWPQIVKALVAWGLEAAWDALKDDRMDPDTEARWRECQRRGGRWDAKRKRCVEPK